jgi:hypothetical protein
MQDHCCYNDGGDWLDGYAIRVRKDERQTQFRLLRRWEKSTGHHKVPREVQKVGTGLFRPLLAYFEIKSGL